MKLHVRPPMLRSLLACAILALVFTGAAVAGHQLPSGSGSGTGTGSYLEYPRYHLEEVGFHALGNKGFNTDIIPWVSQEGGVFAATGTWGSVLGALSGPTANDCPSQDDITGERSGVHIVDFTDPGNPVVAARLRTVPGAQNNDPKVARLPTTGGETDLLVHSLEPCGVEGALHQIPGSPLIDALSLLFGTVELDQTGFQVYDVDDPYNPVKLGAWNNGGIGTHNLWLFRQSDRAFVAAVFNKVDFLGLEESDLIVGILQIVEITDPDSPTLVGEWRLSHAGLDCPARGNDSAHCFLHDVTVSKDGTTAYLSYWDAGLILLDISDPASPQLIGQGLGEVQLPDDAEGWLNEEGNTHAAVPIKVDGRHLVVVGDEDFTGGGEIGVTVNSPAGLAGFHNATQWSGTAPVAGQTADFVYAGTGCTAAHYSGLDVAGKIALVDKYANNLGVRDCPTFLFKQKMDAAEAAGAIGLVQIDSDDAPSGGNAIASGIPGLEISNTAGVPIRNEVTNGDATLVNATLGRGANIDPWGFVRVVDVTDPEPANWREVAQFKAPGVEDANPGAENVFSAHNPVVGPDGRVYVSWYTAGARVLELSNGGASVDEVAWFVPLPSDHEGDNDSDPNGIQEDNVGFWGTWPICHPQTGDLLVFNSDLNRGIYALRSTLDSCRLPDLTLSGGDISLSSEKVTGGDRVTITATVRNVGSEPAADIAVRFTDNGEQIGDVQTISSIPAGGSGTVSVVWDTKHKNGEHTIAVTADPADAIDELDEANNTASIDVLVRGNKVRNGSFEASSSGSAPDNWSSSGETSYIDGGSDGSKSVSTAPSGTWTSDAIAVTPGETYGVSVDVRGGGTLVVEQLSATGELLGTATTLLSVVDDGLFQTVADTMTIGDGVESVRIRLSGSLLGPSGFDDVRLWEE